MCVGKQIPKIISKGGNIKTLIQEDFYLPNIYNGEIVMKITNLKMFM